MVVERLFAVRLRGVGEAGSPPEESVLVVGFPLDVQRNPALEVSWG